MAQFIFGTRPSGVDCRVRRCVYAVIPNTRNLVAAVRANVRGKDEYWLPGGGCWDGESPIDTIAREVREELGRGIRLGKWLGEVVQYYYAGDRDIWIRMEASYVKAEFTQNAAGNSEFELQWANPFEEGDLFFHESHAWVASCAIQRLSLEPNAAKAGSLNQSVEPSIVKTKNE